MSASLELTATCWGTRGSIPTPGAGTLRYGGNTSCLEIRAGGRRYVFDAGTGIRALGRQADGPVDAELFITHFHWDHVQGFPFWGALYDAASRVRVHGPPQDGTGVADLITGMMAPAYFPVQADALAAALAFEDVDSRPWTDGAVEVAALRVCHPGFTCGYRLTGGGASVAYLPDNELGRADAALYRRIVDFVAGAELLIHDATCRDEEYSRYRGWGHSSVGDAVRLAQDAGVGRLLLFHHAPERSDDELDGIVREVRERLADAGSALRVDAAAEGGAINLMEGGA